LKTQLITNINSPYNTRLESALLLGEKLQLLCKHHVALEFDLAFHKGLLSIELARHQSDKVGIGNGNGAISLGVVLDFIDGSLKMSEQKRESRERERERERE
jgi:hypothetical protein